MTPTTTTNQTSLLPSIDTIGTLPKEVLFTSAEGQPTQPEASYVPPISDEDPLDDDENEDLAPGADPGQEDGEYTPPSPNPSPSNN